MRCPLNNDPKMADGQPKKDISILALLRVPQVS